MARPKGTLVKPRFWTYSKSNGLHGSYKPLKTRRFCLIKPHMWFQLKTLLTSILLLMALCFGASAKQAQHENWIDIGAIVVEVGPGVVAAIRGGEFLGKLDYLSKPLAKTQAPSVNYASPGGVANKVGAGRYIPSQPLDAAGNPIVRTNDRGGVLVQPNGSVTCGQHACGMVLNTRGNPVAVDDIISSHPPSNSSGTTMRDMQVLLRDNGVSTSSTTSATVSDLGQFTHNGQPSIAMVQTGPNTYHAVVVDGVTTRGGQQVVAIRDPAGGTNGGVYYETVSSFENRFTGLAIRMDN